MRHDFSLDNRWGLGLTMLDIPNVYLNLTSAGTYWKDDTMNLKPIIGGVIGALGGFGLYLLSSGGGGG